MCDNDAIVKVNPTDSVNVELDNEAIFASNTQIRKKYYLTGLCRHFSTQLMLLLTLRHLMGARAHNDAIMLSTLA